jgi:hypothetical protein
MNEQQKSEIRKSLEEAASALGSEYFIMDDGNKGINLMKAPCDTLGRIQFDEASHGFYARNFQANPTEWQVLEAVAVAANQPVIVRETEMLMIEPAMPNHPGLTLLIIISSMKRVRI